MDIIYEEHNLDNITPASPKFDPSEYAPTKEEAIRRANLDVSRGKVSVFSTCEVPWHGLGTVVNDTPSSAEAIKLANLDNWNLQKTPAFVEVNGQKITTDKFGVVRTDINKCLGVVGNRYEIFSNEECFEFLDEVLDNAKYETAGAINDGKFVWLLARMPNTVKITDNDEVFNYIMFATSHDGSSSIMVYPSNVRVVCQNTYRTSLRNKNSGLSIRHSKNVKSKIAEAKRILGLSHEIFEEVAEKSKFMATHKINTKDFINKIVDELTCETVNGLKINTATISSSAIQKMLDDITDEQFRSLERVMNKRNRVMKQLKHSYEMECDAMPVTAGSAWAAFNAITHAVDHTDIFRYKGNHNKRAEGRFTNLLFGKGLNIKQYAFEEALAMAS